MQSYSKILFVTDDDTSQGPLLALLLGHYLPSTIARVESRGLVVLFPEPMNPKTAAIAASKGMDMSRMSKKLEESDFGEDTLILLLDETKKQTVYAEYKDAVNVYTLAEFMNAPGNVDNPDGGQLSDYAKLFEVLDDIAVKLADKLRYGR